MKCEDFIRLIDAYIDGELDQDTVSEMLDHARECENCARELSAAEMLRDTLSGIDENIVPPLPAQAAWRNAVKAEARKKRMGRIYKICASAAAAVVLMVGLYAGLDAFDNNAKQPETSAATEAGAGFVFVATDGSDATPAPAARTISIADENAACESIISMADEFYGYSEIQGGSDDNVYLTAYIPAESIDQFVDSLGLVGEVAEYRFNDAESTNVTVTITIKTAE